MPTKGDVWAVEDCPYIFILYLISTSRSPRAVFAASVPLSQLATQQLLMHRPPSILKMHMLFVIAVAAMDCRQVSVLQYAEALSSFRVLSSAYKVPRDHMPDTQVR